ncbi:MAG: hypothetical protein NZ805_06640 [Armatimonadetes bacterium]|nr:hypothetical protein [Armatimonadota bacterium]MDW8026762.1 hypothetical protein [Armatimonadota bacterium]
MRLDWLYRADVWRRSFLVLSVCFLFALSFSVLKGRTSDPLQSPDRILKPLSCDKPTTINILQGITQIPLRLPNETQLFSLTLSALDAALLPDEAKLAAKIFADGKVIARKQLHRADSDWYCVFRAEGRKDLALIFESQVSASFKVTVLPMKVSANSSVVLEAEPNDDWHQAQPIPLNATVIGTADDRPYFIAPNMNESDALQAGVDWFKVEQPDENPKLVHFNLDILDRDVPSNILLYTLNDKGELVPYTEGYDPVSGPHEAQVAPPVRLNGAELNSANKFTTRVLQRGVYFIKVEANHPAYRLRMTVYEPPPYLRDENADLAQIDSAARKAIEVAMNYIVAAGDSWFANTPRSGAIPRRDRQVSNETVVCTACHPSQFSTKGTMWANKNGYIVKEREAMRFLAERLYNAPRPFYLPNSVWVRFIGADVHVLSQMALILREYERMTGEGRPDYFEQQAVYLRAFYQRDKLPPNNIGNNEQNPPTLSSYETAWMAWQLLKKVGDETMANHLEKLAITAGEDSIQSLDDLCWQTIFLCEVGREKYADRINANIERIKKEQKPDGSWSYRFNDKPSEFSTATALFALVKAGFDIQDPAVRKGVIYLLTRQKPFGGWNTDGQPYEAFNTPFKETQLALMALSELFPSKTPATGWTNGKQPERIRTENLNETLEDIIAIWDKPKKDTIKQLRNLAQAKEPLLRWESINALCRLADEGSVEILVKALSDETLMVRRAASQGLRELITRRPKSDAARKAVEGVVAALRSPDVKVRRAALRVVNQHFRWLAKLPALTEQILLLAQSDPDPIARMQAVQTLSQWWVWNDDFNVRARILDVVLNGLGDERADKRVLWALRETLYNICDEDVQYVYAFWVPELPREEDRKAALDYFEKLMELQAQKIARVLENAKPFQKRQVLMALTEFPIVREWNVHDQIERNFYRIGNDLDAIDFRGASADILEPVIIRLMDDPDAFVRQRALVLSSYLRSADGRPELANAIVRLIADPDGDVRLLAMQAHKLFPFGGNHVQYGIDPRRYPTKPNFNNETLPLLKSLLEDKTNELPENVRKEVKVNALRIIAEFGEQLKGKADIAQIVKKMAKDNDHEVKAAAFEVARFIPMLHSDPEFQSAVVESLKSSQPNAARRAAVKLAISVNSVGHNPNVSAALDQLLQSERKEDIVELLALARTELTVRDDVRIVPLLENALTMADGDLRTQALTLVRQSKTLANNPAIRLVLQQVTKNTDDGTKQLVQQILEGTSPAKRDPEKVLDFEYFRVRVQPLLAVVGGDGRSCFSCHANQSAFNLRPPDSAGNFPEEISRHNFRSMLRVIDLDNPSESLVLKKPIMEIPHCGGKRWDSKEHPAYQAILLWLNGAKVKQGEALGKQENL